MKRKEIKFDKDFFRSILRWREKSEVKWQTVVCSSKRENIWFNSSLNFFGFFGTYHVPIWPNKSSYVEGFPKNISPNVTNIISKKWYLHFFSLQLHFLFQWNMCNNDNAYFYIEKTIIKDSIILWVRRNTGLNIG